VHEIVEGLRAVVAHPVVKAVTGSAAIAALAGQMQGVVVVLFLVRTLHLGSLLVGLMMTVAGVAGILGALTSVPITSRLGNGPTFVTGMLLASVAGLVMAAASGPLFTVVSVLVVAQFLRGWGPALYGINQQTIRQVLIPADLLPRAQATWRFLVYGAQAVGALLGGLLGAAVGLRATLIISSIGMLVGTGFAAASQVRALHRLPATPGVQSASTG
jgi:MFS family permease